MPGRILIPGRWLTHHVREHPGRLVATALAVLLFSVALFGYVLITSADAAHRSRVEACIATNELSRKIYVTLADFGTPVHIRAKFLPTRDCEDIP